jgi:hypothetical protein
VALIALRDRNHEPKVRIDHPFLRVVVTTLDALRQLDFLRCGQEGIAPGLVHEELQRVRGRRCQVAVDVHRRFGALLATVVFDPDLPFLRLLVDPFHVLFREIEALRHLIELGEAEAVRFFGLVEQRCELGMHLELAIPTGA